MSCTHTQRTTINDNKEKYAFSRKYLQDHVCNVCGWRTLVMTTVNTKFQGREGKIFRRRERLYNDKQI